MHLSDPYTYPSILRYNRFERISNPKSNNITGAIHHEKNAFREQLTVLRFDFSALLKALALEDVRFLLILSSPILPQHATCRFIESLHACVRSTAPLVLNFNHDR
jgi:hypothetical protein